MSEIAAHLEHLIREPFLAGGRWLGECSSTKNGVQPRYGSNIFTQ